MSDDLLKRARRLDTCIFPNERSKCLCGELADRIEKLEADLETATMNRLLDSDRIEKLEAALDDALQYVSSADWHYLKDETRKALEGEDG